MARPAKDREAGRVEGLKRPLFFSGPFDFDILSTVISVDEINKFARPTRRVGQSLVHEVDQGNPLRGTMNHSQQFFASRKIGSGFAPHRS